MKKSLGLVEGFVSSRYISEIRDKTVTVIRVMYGGRDIDKQLKKSVL